MQNIVDNIKNLINNSTNKFINSFEDFHNALLNLSFEDNLHVLHLTGSLSIFLCLTTIISIIYTNQLIDYLKLEVRYPKIAKYLLLRKKLQNYYLLFNAFIIFIICTIIFIVNLNLLNII